MPDINDAVALGIKPVAPPDVVGQITSLAQLQYLAARGQEAQAQAGLTQQNLQFGQGKLNAIQQYGSLVSGGMSPEDAVIKSGLSTWDPQASGANLGNIQTGMTIKGTRGYAANPTDPLSASPGGPALVGAAATAGKTMADTTTTNLENTGRIGLYKDPSSLSSAALAGGAPGVASTAETNLKTLNMKGQIANELLASIGPDGSIPPQIKEDAIQKAVSAGLISSGTGISAMGWPDAKILQTANAWKAGAQTPVELGQTTGQTEFNKGVANAATQSTTIGAGDIPNLGPAASAVRHGQPITSLADIARGGAAPTAPTQGPFGGLPSTPLSPAPGAPPSAGLPQPAPGRTLGPPPGLQPVAAPALPPGTAAFAPAVPGTIRNANEIPPGLVGPAAPSAGGTTAPTPSNAEQARITATAASAPQFHQTGLTPQNVGQQIYAGLIQRGFTPVQAAALTGNMKQESEFNPAAPNPTEGGIGLLQWRLDRRNALNAFAAQQGKSPTDLNTQLDFVKYEMDGPEAASAAPFLKATTLADANQALHGYIRYGDNSEPTRLGYAQSIAGGKFPVGNLVAPPPSSATPGARPAIFGSDQPVAGVQAPGTLTAAAAIPVPAALGGQNPLAPAAPSPSPVVAPVVPSPTAIPPVGATVEPAAAVRPAPVAAPAPGVTAPVTGMPADAAARPLIASASSALPPGYQPVESGMSLSQKAELEGQGKAYGELPAKLDAAASSAKTMNATLDEVSQAALNGSWTPGKWAPFKENLREGFQSITQQLGIATPNLDTAVADYQDMNKVAGNLLRSAAHDTSSRVGVQELQLIQKSMPGPEMSPGGIGFIIPQMKGLNDFAVAKQQAASGWRAINNGSMGPLPQKGSPDFSTYWNQQASPAAFVLHRMQLDNPEAAKTIVSRMLAEPNGKPLVKSLISQLKWANDAGILPKMAGDIYVTRSATPPAPSDSVGAPGPASTGDQVVAAPSSGQSTIDMLQGALDASGNAPSATPVPAATPAPPSSGQATIDLLTSGLDGKLPPPPKKAEPATATSIGANLGAGLSEGAIDTLGAPVDAISWGLRKLGGYVESNQPGVGGLIAATPLPANAPPFMGSEFIKQGLGLINSKLNPENTVAQNPAESIARGIGSGASSAIVPEAGAVGLGQAGLAKVYPQAIKALESAFGTGTSAAQTGINAGVGALGGGTGEAAAASPYVPEPLKPIARLTGNLVGGAAGAVLPEVPAGWHAAVEGARDYVAPFQGGAESPQKLALAQRMFAKGVSDRDQALANLQNNPTTGVGEVPLTAYQASGDRGVGAMEREAETANPIPYNARREAQNEARVGAIKALQPTGDPAAVSAHLRDQLAELDDALAGIERKATEGAREKAGEIGGTSTPEDIGNVARAQLGANHAGAKAWEKALWEAVDPEGKLALGTAPISAAARRIEAGMSETAKTAKPIEGAERKLFDAAAALGGVAKLKEVTDLRSLVSEEMRAQRGPNGSPTVLARLTQLRGAIEQAIIDAAEHKAAQESVAVQSGAMRAEETLAARLQAERHGFDQAESTRANVSGDGSRNDRGQSQSVRSSHGTEVQGGGGSGNASGNQSLSSSPEQQARLLSSARPAHEGEKVVNIDVAKVDKDWKDTGYHVAPGAEGKAKGADDFLSSLKDGETFTAPSLGVAKYSDGNVVGFDDGRHRFAAMRDAGMKTAPVSMDEQSLENARRLGYIVDEPKAPLTANMDEEAANRIKLASEATKEKNDTFKKGPVGDFLAERGAKDDFRILDSGFGGKFWKPGASGADAVRAFAAATGKDPDAIRTLSDAAALSLRKAAVDDKTGVMDPGKYAAWAKSHGDALRALGEVSDAPEQFATAAKAGEAVADATAMRAAALDAYQKGALGKVMGISDPEGVTDEVAKIFGKSDRIQAMRQLAAEVKDNPDARDGLRKALANFLETKAISNKDKVKGDVFQTFVKQNRPALAQVFDKDELKGIDAVAAELKRVSQLADEQALPGRSTTAQDIMKSLKAAQEGHPHLSLFAEMVLGGGAGFEAGGVKGAAAGAGAAVAKSLLSAKRATGMHDVSALMQKMILHPEVARTALEQVAPTKLISRDIRFTQQLNRVAAISASRMIANRQDSNRAHAK